MRLRAAPVATALAGHVDWLDALAVMDELAEDHLVLSIGLARLERTSHVPPLDLDLDLDLGPEREGEPDPATRAALRTFDERVEDLGRVRDALAAVHDAAIPRCVQRVFVPDAPLADYLRGLYAWTHAVVWALDDLGCGLRALQPDWAAYRRRIEDAENFHFDELEDAVNEDLASLLEDADAATVAALARAFERLLLEARTLALTLAERFG